jgi:hypothetical protein
VEQYGFDRTEFPFYINGHKLHLLQNDGRVLQYGRLLVHITLYCEYCDKERTFRGRSAASQEWVPQHLQDVKVAALAEYVNTPCEW